MSWNYRIVKEEKKSPTGATAVGYTIREVYYDMKGRIQATTLDPCYPCGSDEAELKNDLELMARAFEKPIINIEDVPDPDAVIIGESYSDKDK
jgi:hypothetical protein